MRLPQTPRSTRSRKRSNRNIWCSLRLLIANRAKKSQFLVVKKSGNKIKFVTRGWD